MLKTKDSLWHELTRSDDQCYSSMIKVILKISCGASWQALTLRKSTMICFYIYILGKFLHDILFHLEIFCPSNLLFCVCCFLKSDKQSYV